MPPKIINNSFDVYDFVFPVLVGTKYSNGTQFHIGNIAGTAFYIGGDMFMTAGHVISGSQGQDFALGYEDDHELQPCDVGQPEIFQTPDVAIIRSNISRAQALPWHVHELPMGSDVSSPGYPWAYMPEHQLAVVRFFKGYVVTQRSYPEPDGRNIYELSFQVPGGLSGAPVISNFGGRELAGLVIGTHTTKTMTATYTEIDTTDGHITRVTNEFDAFNVGLALQARAIVGLQSKLLNMSVAEHLSKYGLLSI